ncbi:BON domain-containing protein [Paraburkholderia ferrariae]|uniref:BON domain-containing protein n=1 Tax=Paraburkholderia ferrariae TaxID=386056 RepID=UPI0005A90926|nr:BON domain-containing protein [Paraburkholderia ferrariae]
MTLRPAHRPQRALAWLAALLLATSGLAAHAQGGSEASAATGASSSPAPAASAPTDRQLAASVRHALRAARKQGLKSTYIRVRARNGAITLTGIVASQDQIAIAASVAQGVSGVRSVTSRIEVRDGEGLKGSQ